MGRSVDVVRETERKYEAGDGDLPDPPKLLGLAAPSGPEVQQLEAVYFDTSDLRLLRARVTLRRREGGSDEGWHLKLPAGTDSRDEHRLPLTAGGRTEPPAELASLVRVHSRGAALVPVAQLSTRRRRWLLSDEKGGEVVELVEDEVHAHTMGAATSSLSWREIEVELAEHGRVEMLDRIEKRLAKVGVRRSSSKSKLGRVLADRLAAEPPPGRKAGSKKKEKGARRKPGSAGAAVMDYLRRQAEQIRAQDPLVRSDSPDAIHQMRVGARRMRSALQAYGKVVDRSATRSLAGELKWLGGVLSEARDSEVIEQRLAEAIGELPGELVMGPVASQVTRALARRRSDGQAAAIAALDSDRYLALHDAIDTLLDEPPLRKAAARPARRELPRHTGRAWRRVAKRMAVAEALDPGPERDVALHELRKAAKRLRYAAEVAGPAVGKRARRLRKRAKSVATRLGDHQDAVVAKAVIRRLAVQAHLDGGNAFTFGVLHEVESERAAAAERGLPRAVTRLRRAVNA